jgi:DnaJ-class molecular chaperone
MAPKVITKCPTVARDERPRCKRCEGAGVVRKSKQTCPKCLGQGRFPPIVSTGAEGK